MRYLLRLLLPSVTLSDVKVPAPAPSVPLVLRFSFPKSIAPELSTILPVDMVIVPSTLNWSDIVASSVVVNCSA